MSLCLHKVTIIEPRLKNRDSFQKFVYARKHLQSLGYSIGYLPSLREVPCRSKCVICKLQHTAEIIGELFAESTSFNGVGWFCTLTLDDRFITNNSVSKSHVLSLRDACNKHSVRYYMTSEYGTHTDRPHYHAILFSRDIVGHDAVCEFIRKYFKFGLIEVDLLNFARIRYTANAHVNKCSHVPYYFDDDVLLPCSDNFILKSRALGDEYIRKHARKIFEDNYMTFEGINFPLSDTTKKHLYKYLGLNQYEQGIINDFRRSDFDPVDFYRKLAKKFNYNLLFSDDYDEKQNNISRFREYLAVAEQQLNSQYYSRFVRKSSPNTNHL